VKPEKCEKTKMPHTFHLFLPSILSLTFSLSHSFLPSSTSLSISCPSSKPIHTMNKTYTPTKIKFADESLLPKTNTNTTTINNTNKFSTNSSNLRINLTSSLLSLTEDLLLSLTTLLNRDYLFQLSTDFLSR